MSACSRLVCAGCGAVVGAEEPYPFSCPSAGVGDVDHVLRRRLDHDRLPFPFGPSEHNPFIRYRELLHSYHAALVGGLNDVQFCELVRALDARVAAVDGHGFAVTPFQRDDELSGRLGFSSPGGVWVKDETGNVSGSHKARHLFEVLLQLEVAEIAGWIDPYDRAPLAIASCGNAALAAAVLAAAAGRSLVVFVPPDADPVVSSRLEDLGAEIITCERSSHESGDPTYRALLGAIRAGALPFTCQGNLNGLAVEGGMTLAYEIVSTLAKLRLSLDRLVVQVGGGALASACFEALEDAHELGRLHRLPRIDTVQTHGAAPLRRAYELVVREGGRAAVFSAARHRSRFMWPWSPSPRSIAHGIIDDETYDWVAVVEAMLTTGGRPYVVDEKTLLDANELARDATGIDVDHTGSSGLAGLVALRDSGEVGPHERVAVLFTGVARATPQAKEGKRDEKLSRQGHPVAQGI
jgi:threonine synthase